MEDRRKRFLRFRNFLTKYEGGVQWNIGRPQDRETSSQLLKARGVYYSEMDQIELEKKFELSG